MAVVGSLLEMVGSGVCEVWLLKLAEVKKF